MSESPVITTRLEVSRDDWKRLNRLLAHALELEAPERTDWIASLPATDRDLSPLLEQLLARPELAEAAGSAPSPSLLRSDALPREGVRVEDRPGAHIGPYRLLREIGRGGMGTVWLADRVDAVIQRQVALKLPRAEWVDRGLAERMARERSALASLNHPSIAQLYDAGWAADGRPYLALEYVEGDPIDAWCNERRLPTADRVRLFIAALRAVAFAHAKLVIHRDLKPGNVIVTADGQVKLLDFGIAKLLNSDSAVADETALARASGRALTLNYAAPEQVLGGATSTAADTYSAGVLLYELLSGSRPYHPARDSRAALEDAVLNADPPAPSTVAADQAAARALRGDLDTIVLKALRKRPEQRYETASAFADDLERWLDGRPVRAQRSSGWYRTRRLIGRHRRRFAAGAVAIVALLGGAGAVFWQGQVADREAARANSVRNFVLAIIAQADPMVSAATRDADLTLLVTAESRLAEELGRYPKLALELRAAIAEAYLNRGEIDRAGTTLRSAIEAARKVLPRDEPILLRAWIRTADWRVMPPDEVVPELDFAVAQARGMGRSGVEMLVEALIARSTLQLVERGRLDSRLADLKEAYETAVRFLGPAHPLALRAVTRRLQYFTGDRTELVPLLESAYRAAEASPTLARTHPERLQIQFSYAKMLCETGHGKEGLALMEETLSAARAKHGSGRATEQALASLWVGRMMTGDVRGALAVAKEALALASAREPDATLGRNNGLRMAMTAAIASRRIDEAAALMKEVERFATPAGAYEPRFKPMLVSLRSVWYLNYSGNTTAAEALGKQVHEKPMPDPFSTRVFNLAYSFALRQNGKPAAARQVLEASLDARLGVYDRDEDYLGELALVRLALGETSGALDDVDRAIALKARTLLQPDPALIDLRLVLGQALLGLGRTGEALAEFRNAAEFWRVYDARSVWAAEADYWLARALIETGDGVIGRAMLKSAQVRLAKSPLPLHRKLAEATSPNG